MNVAALDDLPSAPVDDPRCMAVARALAALLAGDASPFNAARTIVAVLAPAPEETP